MSNRPTVRIHAELAEVSMSQKLDRCYRLWLAAKATDTEGRGLVWLSDVHENCVKWDVRGLKSRASLSRIADQGDGFYWSAHILDGSKRLALHSPTRVARMLDIDRVHKPIEVELPQSLREFRALCTYARFGGERPSNPISQAKIAEKVGKNDRTIRNYQNEIPGLEVHRNAAVTGQSWHPGMQLKPGHYPDYVGNDIIILRGLPSSYVLNARVCAKSGTKKINRTLQSFSNDTSVGNARRLFYREGDRGAHRRIQSRTEGDSFFVQTRGKTRGGAKLWQLWQFVNGQLHTDTCGAYGPAPGCAWPTGSDNDKVH